MNKAIFLDRDGVINEDGGYIYKPEDFHFKDGIFDFCRAAGDKGYLLIVCTNQSGIARGYYTEEEYLALNDWMLEEFKKYGVRIAKTYCCPDYPDSPDRKPNSGMLLKAKMEFDIDMAGSIIIGDKASDIEAGRGAEVGKLIYLQSSYDKPNGADFEIIISIMEVVKFL
ncbi:MAG: HAD family hydrolase [Clostridiales bacterium]|jgi:D-glycero-D-manno-heptose 1,7-bisphosphate phosphatase|nr:HAD family hydrolase [Clostridiales bacterium]